MTYIYHARIPGRNLGEAVLIWIWTLTFYLKKFFFAWDVTPGYDLPKPINLGQGPYLAAVGILVFLVWFFWRKKNDRWLNFAVIYYLASIFFLLRYDDKMDFHIVADRFMYLPSLGFCIFGALVLSRLYARSWRWGKSAPYLLISITGALGILLILKTNSQIRLWKDDIAIWDSAVTCHPDKFYVYDNRGHALAQRGEFVRALADFNRAIDLNPKDYFAYNNRGNLYDALNQPFLAWQDYNQAIKINPGAPMAYFNRGMLQERLGHKTEAIKDYSLAAERNPREVRAYEKRGTLYFSQGEYAKALPDLDKAIALDTRNAAALNNRAIIYFQRGELTKALNDLTRVIHLEPQNPQNYFHRGLLYYRDSQWQEALHDFAHVLALNPNHAEARRFNEAAKKRLAGKN